MKLAFAVLALITAQLALADDSKSQADPATQEALSKTAALLLDAKQFNKAANENETTKKANASFQQALPDSDDQQEGRELSNMILKKIVEETNGDPQKMKEIVQQLQSNPNLLEKYLTPEAKEKLHGLGNKIESKMGRVAPAR